VDGNGGVRLNAAVDRVEALGANLLVYFGVDAPRPDSAGVAAALGARLEEVTHLGRAGTEFCATFEPRTGVRVGDRVEVVVDAERLHFFDPETESAIF
jgi:multiple sugar transport system ATP-binding protein